jgi:hypothetical protein
MPEMNGYEAIKILKSKKETRNDGIVGTSCISRFSAFFWEAVVDIKGPHVDKIPFTSHPKFFNPL